MYTTVKHIDYGSYCETQGFKIPVGTWKLGANTYIVTTECIHRSTTFGTKKILSEFLVLSNNDRMLLEIELSGLARALGM